MRGGASGGYGAPRGAGAALVRVYGTAGRAAALAEAGTRTEAAGEAALGDSMV
jgi:hypothetical protein